MAGKRWNNCNVLATGVELRRLWQFDAKGKTFKLGRELTVRGGDPLPAFVNKTWRSLGQPKLNIACLPPERVFLRVAQFPNASFDETLAMVELQLEKLSPMPVGQIVWTIHCLPHPDGAQQTVILTMAARDAVEAFLGNLESQGYLADRLELPGLDQLLHTKIDTDGAWIYPELLGGVETAVVAWWYGGILRSLDLLTLPAGADRTAVVREQLSQMAWSGEVEGWITSSPRWHLVASDAVAPTWQAVLRDGLGESVAVIPPLPAAELAALTATRSATSDERATLLPAEFATRYHQRFTDRLWMRAVGAVVVLYLIGLAVYFSAVGVSWWRTDRVEQQVKQLSGSYTNALQLKARYDVLKDRQELKFAALDSWKVVAEYFPEGVTLETFTFRDGKEIVLNGTASGDDMGRIIDFSDAVKRAKVDGRQLFNPARGDAPTRRPGPGNTIAWTFSLELNRTELK
jgi:hypothetical protein